MIPNVCMVWCQKKAICGHCEKEIEVGAPMVTVFFWNKGNDNRRWNVKKYYHPNCWIEQGLDYLKMNPYVPYRRGGNNKFDLTPEQKEKRKSILRKKASLEQRRRKLKSDYPDRILIEARIDSQIADLAVEIGGIGGIPKRWLNQLISKS